MELSNSGALESSSFLQEAFSFRCHVRLTPCIRCQVCREHFTAMYGTCENERCKIHKQSNIRNQQSEQDQTALALWVWRAHNAVNARLATEDDKDANM